MSRGLKLVLVVLLQTVALVTMVGMKQYTLNTGTPILLETEPVDPRSLFSGDYVRLNYKISRLDVDRISKESREWKRHETIYVTLKPSQKYAEPVGVAREMRTPKSGEVVIKGEVEWASSTVWNATTNQEDKGNFVNLRYGIENYFVPEGEGREIERRVVDGVDQKLDVRVAVDKNGAAGIKAILLNGEERYVEKLF